MADVSQKAKAKKRTVLVEVSASLEVEHGPDPLFSSAFLQGAFVVILTLLLIAFRLFYVAHTPYDLSPDEAQYWDFSRHLDWSYYSKPPLVAWLVAVSTHFWGQTAFAVRFFSAIGSTLLPLLCFFFVRAVSVRREGILQAGWVPSWTAFALLTLTPLFGFGGLLMTPDVPCLVFWTLALMVLLRIDFLEQRPQTSLFLLMGALIGLATLGKYSGILFYPLLMLYLAVDSERRAWLFRAPLYQAMGVTALFLLPVLYWNVMHDFVGVRHVLGQIHGEAAPLQPLKTAGNFLGGQLGLLGPVTFLMMLFMWGHVWKQKAPSRSDGWVLLWWFSAPLFAAFLLKSFVGKVQPNWPVLAVLSGVLLLSLWVSHRSAVVRRVFVGGLALWGLVTIVTYDSFVLRDMTFFPKLQEKLARKEPAAELLGWRGLGAGVSALQARLGGDVVVLTSRYQTAAELGFYMVGKPEVLYINPGYRRQNQYDYWPWPADMEKKVVLYVRENGTMEPEIFTGFTSCLYLGKVAGARENVVLRTANVYACAGYKGLERVRASTY